MKYLLFQLGNVWSHVEWYCKLPINNKTTVYFVVFIANAAGIVCAVNYLSKSLHCAH